jgi:hypothetical protein
MKHIHLHLQIPPGACDELRRELARLIEKVQTTKDNKHLVELFKDIAVVEAALKKCPDINETDNTPDLAGWLGQHTAIANAIQWQFQRADPQWGYTPPTNADKIAWSDWSPTQKADLDQAFSDAVTWLSSGATQVQNDPNGLTDMPTNIQPNVNDDSVTVIEWVSEAYMWQLYIAHVALSLALETTNTLPWSITTYDSASLRYLFDSTTMAWNLGGYFWMGTYAMYVPTLRADNRPKSNFGPPKWTYPFLKQANLVGTTRIDTIGRVLQWMREKLAHFIGSDTFGNCYAIWQYRGYPPLSRVVNGTIDSNNPSSGTQHWTMGCHGSVGLLHQLLRVVNIPVQPVWIAGHELACFMSEKMYLDHGDDPYNLNVKNSTQPILKVLIDEPTYQSWFTNDLTINITDLNSPAGANIGRSAQQFPQ